MNLSIIIINWNTHDLLGQCLRSIFANPPGSDFEIWVIDNGSTDRSLEMLKESFPSVKVIANHENVGFARANNQGMQQAEGEYFLLINSDTIVQPGAIDGMLHTAEENPEAGIVGCKLLNQDGSIQESWAEFPTVASEILGRNFRKRTQVSSGEALYRVDWVGGACLLVRKEAVQQVGMLDESYFMYSEEVDWCYRMKASGWNTYFLESVEIIHLGGGSARRTSFDQLLRLYDSKLRFFKKNYGKWQARLLKSCLILVILSGIIWREISVFLKLQRDQDQRGRLQSQWQLIRRLWVGSLS
ncbi:MAG: glycosyltransferase family 2 protein [Omnitrophica WOR_2 bacterium]